MAVMMIENSDRGITLNKSLAWTMLVALVTAVWWGGSTITKLNAATENLTATLSETRALIAETRNVAASATAQLEGRVRGLETSATRSDTRFDALAAGLSEVKAALAENNTLLRQVIRAGNP